MCQSTTNCCVACCVPTRGKGLWVTIAVLIAASFALVCVWAYVAVKVDALLLLLLRTAHLTLTDTPTVVTSWWSPTARHLLAREVAAGRLALPAGPGVIQATMAALTLAPAGLVTWVCYGCPVPVWVRARVRARVAGPVTARLERLPARRPAAVRRAQVSARTARASATAALPGPATPQRAALPSPAAPPSAASVSVLPLRFIRLTRPAPPAADPAARSGSHRADAPRR